MAADGIADWRLAPAKINLSLHLKGQRPDGYHLLDSLVVFAGVGDRILAEDAPNLSLTVNGPFAQGLSTGADNLVLKAAMGLASGRAPGTALLLEKNLPMASGIGGGSSDAAATLALLSGLWGIAPDPKLAARLGADVPVCCAAPAPQIMRGIGDRLTPAPVLPPLWIVLVNPLIGVPTGAVFAEVADRNPPAPPEIPTEGFARFDDLIGWLRTQRNDLQSAAIRVCPVIADVLASLADAPFRRMSGSGATCFALLPSEKEALVLADAIRKEAPWWVSAAPVLGP